MGKSFQCRIFTYRNIIISFKPTAYFCFFLIRKNLFTKATCISNFSFIFLYRKKEEFGFDFHPSSFKPSRRYVGMITSLGTPMAIQSGFINVSMLYVNSMINSLGVAAGEVFGEISKATWIEARGFYVRLLFRHLQTAQYSKTRSFRFLY